MASRRKRVSSRRSHLHFGQESRGRFALDRRAPRAFETLEDRNLLANSSVIISEITPDNQTLVAANGATADWLEITNTSATQAVSLNGWSLKYGGTPTTWNFPNMNLGPNESRVIFCDSTPTSDPTQELHTNFNLSKSGKTIVLTDNISGPTGYSASYTYPAMEGGISWGTGETVTQTALVSAGATVKYSAPTSTANDAPANGGLGVAWAQPGFNDNSWASGTTGLGFDQVPGFSTNIYKSSSDIGNLAAADSVVAGNFTSKQTLTAASLNYAQSAGTNSLGTVAVFPGGVNTTFVIQATGSITVPTTGNYTFDLNSDDGARMSIGGTLAVGDGFTSATNQSSFSQNTLNADFLRGASDTLGVAHLTAGTYPITITYFQNGGGASFYFADAPGAKTSFDSTFKLVGASGGLAVNSVPNNAGTTGTSPINAAIQTNVRNAVQSAINTAGSTSLYTRITFNDPATLQNLTLQMQYSSAYIAYLNGVEIASSNVVTKSVSGITSSGLTATVTSPSNGFVTGNVVHISGASQAAYNGDFTITKVDANTFTYTLPSATTSPATGTILARKTAFNAIAAEKRTSEVQSATYENIDVSQFLNSGVTGHLNATNNVLAVQVLMSSPTDSSMLVSPALSQIAITPAGTHFFQTPTPGTYNLPGSWQPDLTFGKTHGYYTTPFPLTLTTTTSGASIYYTTDNSPPSATHGTLYTGAITISATTALRAVTVVPGGSSGVVQTQTFIFPAQVVNQSSSPAGFPTAWGITSNDSPSPEPSNYGMSAAITQDPQYSSQMIAALTSLPTVSITTTISNIFDGSQTVNPNATQNTGIYTNINNLQQSNGVDMVVPASFEYFNPDGSLSTQVNAGLEMEGGVGRYPQYQLHSFRLNFSSDYGPSKLELPIYGKGNGAADSFDTLILKSGFNDAWSGNGSAAQYMRDVFVAQTQLAMGDPAFHTQYVSLYVDGLFWGLYMLDERPDSSFTSSYLGDDSSDWESNNAGHAVNGSDSNLPMWSALQNFNVANSATNDLSTLTGYEKIQGNNPDGTRNPAYPVLLNATNYADYMLLNLYLGNTDWPGHNFYAADNITSDSTGFEFFSWDAEWTMGINSDLNTNDTGVSGGVATVFSELLHNTEFDTLFADRARKFMFDGGALTPAVLEARYQTLVNELNVPIIANAARWGTINGAANTPANWVAEANSVLNSYLPYRGASVLAQFRAAGLYPSIDAPAYALNGTNKYGGTFNVGDVLTLSDASGPIYYTLDGSDPRLVGGALSSKAILYTGPITLNAGVEVKSRAYTSAHVWSALSDASFAINFAPSIRISEIMYNPPAATSAEIAAGYTGTDNNDFEYVELQNTGTQTLPLQGLQFTNGITFTFPNISIAPGGYVLVVSNLTAFHIRYPNVSNSIIAGQYTGKFDNSGEEVALSSPLGGTFEDFTYDDKWFPQTDGGGFSLQVRDTTQPTSGLNAKAGWNSSGSPLGSPGTAETNPIPLPGSVQLNEVLANPNAGGTDMVELYNSTSAPINIGNWWLSDSPTALTKYHIAPGTILPANGYLVFTDAQNYGASFQLGKYGFGIYLSSSAGLVAGGYRDSRTYGATPQGVSVGQFTKSTGGTDWVLLGTPTFGGGAGAANSSVAYVPPVDINEVMYAPSAPTTAEQAAGYTDSSAFEYLELYNRSGVSQPLSSLYVGNGVAFSFGWLGDGAAGESETLESGATATWNTSNLPAGTYTVYAKYSQTDATGAARTADTTAGYSVTYPGGTLNVPVIDQNTAVAGKLTLGTITVSGSGNTQVKLTRGGGGAADWTLANQIEFVKSGTDITTGSPTLNSYATASGRTTLAPGASIVLVSNLAAFDSRYHIAANNIPVGGVYTGKLDNSGELVSLYQAGPVDAGTGYQPYYEIDRINYTAAAPWPAEAGGQGPSLIRIHTADYGNDVLSWRAGNAGGTPGSANIALDNSPPTVPTGLSGVATLSPNRVSLQWSASTDSQSYVDHYAIYRNGLLLTTSVTTSYVDTTVAAAANYTYTVSAVNRDGYASAQSASLTTGLPGISSSTWLDSKTLQVTFSEPLTTAANVVSHYGMSAGLSVTSATLSRGNTVVTLSLNSSMVANTGYTLTINGLATTSGDQLPASIPVTFTFANTGSGSILRQVWTNLDSSNAVNDLVNPSINPNYPNNPSFSGYVTSFESPASGLQNYGQRIQGYITPPTTGLYTFWIASDDNSQLWLSTDSNPANIGSNPIAYVANWTNSREWTKETNQQSAQIPLVAGQRYYIEALMKQGGGGENLAVRWQLPDGSWENGDSTAPIPGIRLSPLNGAQDLTPPAAPTGLKGTLNGSSQVALSWGAVSIPTSGLDHYVIFRDGVSYATSTTTSFTDSTNISATSPHTYQVEAINWDGTVGALSSSLKVAPVGIQSATAGSTTSMIVTFSEPLNLAAAQTTANYHVSGITFTSAVLQADGATVVLTSSSTLPSGSFNLSVTGMTTRTGVSLPTLSSTVTTISPAWSVSVYSSVFGVNTLNGATDGAQTVIDNPADQNWKRVTTAQYINYGTGATTSGNFNSSGSGNQLVADNGVPSQTGTYNVTDTVNNYVIQATGQIYIPAGGPSAYYAFDVNSDDGFRLTITGASFSNGTNLSPALVSGSNNVSFDGGRGATDSIAVATFPAAGYYPIKLLYFQGGGPSSVEVSARAQTDTNTTFDSNFRLIGDTAHGGLSMANNYSAPQLSVAVNPLSTGNTSPAISGTVTDASATLTARVNGIYYAVANNNGSWTLPAGTIPPLTSGTYDVSVTATNGAGQRMFDTTTNELTVDSTAPTASFTPVNPSGSAPASLQLHFSKPISGLDLQDLSLTFNGLSTPLGTATLTSANQQDWTIGNLSGALSSYGTYALSLTAAGSGIADVSGNALLSGASVNVVIGTPPKVIGVYVSSSAWDPSFEDYLDSAGLGNPAVPEQGYALIGGANQLKDLPWLGLNTIRVQFDSNVNVTQGSLALFGSPDNSLSGVDDVSYPTSGFSYDVSTHIATWTFGSGAGKVFGLTSPGDMLMMQLHSTGGSQISGNSSANTGLALDGEFRNPSASNVVGQTLGASNPSGNNTPGGDFLYRFNVLPGDTDRDGYNVATGDPGAGGVGTFDATPVRARFGASSNGDIGSADSNYTPYLDIDGSGDIGTFDFTPVRARFGNVLPIDPPGSSSLPGGSFALPGGSGSAATAAPVITGAAAGSSSLSTTSSLTGIDFGLTVGLSGTPATTPSLGTVYTTLASSSSASTVAAAASPASVGLAATDAVFESLDNDAEDEELDGVLGMIL